MCERRNDVLEGRGGFDSLEENKCSSSSAHAESRGDGGHETRLHSRSFVGCQEEVLLDELGARRAPEHDYVIEGEVLLQLHPGGEPKALPRLFVGLRQKEEGVLRDIREGT